MSDYPYTVRPIDAWPGERTRFNGEVVHIAGLVVQIGPSLRQRCAWCAHTLIDYDLRRVLMAVGTEDDGEASEGPATWPVGGLVAVDGGYSSLVEHADGEELPLKACGRS